MKVKLLALAVTAAVAMPGLALADGPTVYGKMNLSLENVDVDAAYAEEGGPETSADRWDVLSNASRFGVKGDAKINSMLKATYLIEWEVSGEGDAPDMGQRNRSVGLAGNFGALDVGKFDTPLKVSQGKVDQFNDLSGDLKHVLVGEDREEDIIQYSTPTMSGLQAKLAVMPGEQYDVGQDDANDGFADAISASVSFTQDALYVALAHDSDVVTDAYLGLDDPSETEASDVLAKDSAAMDTTRLVGQFTTGPLQLGLMYQMSESSDSVVLDSIDEDIALDVEQDGFLLSGAYTIGQTVLKAQYTSSTTEFSPADFDGNTLESDAEMIGLGVDQKLSAQTTVFGYYNMLSYELDVEGGEEQTKDNLGVGIVHAF